MLFLSSSIVCLKITGSRHSSCPQLALNRNLLCKRFLCKSVSGLCVYACACAHNYRCAILPKAVIKKGTGMTPTTTTAWGYVTSSSWILSYPGDSWNLSCTAGCPWKCSSFKPRRSLVFFPTCILSLILAERKKPDLVFLCLCLARSVVLERVSTVVLGCVRVRAQWALLCLSSWDAGGPQTKEKMAFRALQDSYTARRVCCAGKHLLT